MCLQRCEQMGHRESQGIRDADEAQHGEVALALLNLTDVPESQACSGGKCWLRESLVVPVLAESRSKEPEQRGRVTSREEWCVLRRPSHMRSRPGGERITRCGRGKSDAGIQSCEQAGSGNFQGVRQAEQHQHGNIVQTPFDVADIGAAYACSGSKCPLRETSLLPVHTEGRPKKLQRCVLRACRV